MSQATLQCEHIVYCKIEHQRKNPLKPAALCFSGALRMYSRVKTAALKLQQDLNLQDALARDTRPYYFVHLSAWNQEKMGLSNDSQYVRIISVEMEFSVKKLDLAMKTCIV